MRQWICSAFTTGYSSLLCYWALAHKYMPTHSHHYIAIAQNEESPLPNSTYRTICSPPEVAENVNTVLSNLETGCRRSHLMPSAFQSLVFYKIWLARAIRSCALHLYPFENDLATCSFMCCNMRFFYWFWFKPFRRMPWSAEVSSFWVTSVLFVSTWLLLE